MAVQLTLAKKRTMQAITKPYRFTWQFMRAAPGFVLAMALLLLGIDVLSDYLGKGLSVTFVPYLCLLFSMLRAMMFGETALLRPARPLVRPFKLGWFLITGFVLFLFLMVLTLGLFLIVDGATGFQSTAETRIGPLAFTLIFSFCVVAAGLGTMVPASAAADYSDFAQRVVNAVKSAPRVFLGMLFGPCLCLIVLLIGLGSSGVLDGSAPYQDANGAFDLTKILIAVPLAVLRISIGFLAAAVLILAYRTRAPQEITDAMV